jgi:hypothetical protein
MVDIADVTVLQEIHTLFNFTVCVCLKVETMKIDTDLDKCKYKYIWQMSSSLTSVFGIVIEYLTTLLSVIC